MIKYLCKRCNTESEDSECSICKDREINNSIEMATKPQEEKYRNEFIESIIYWCDNCKTPLYNGICNKCGRTGKKISADIRPVFPEERLLLEATLNLNLDNNKNIWNISGNRYIVDGKRLKVEDKEVVLDDIIFKDPNYVRNRLKILREQKLDELYNEFQNEINRFVQCNQQRLSEIEYRAFQFVRDVAKKFKRTEMFVSFSGGKDSSVTSSIVTRALAQPNTIHIYGDTTLEFKETSEYIERFKVNNKFIPFKIAINKEKRFEDMCNLVGPPSRVMRWCCTIFKTGAITRKVDTLFKGKQKILSFHGIRWRESSSRKKYTRISSDSKIAKQLVACPIIDWMDFDVWLYLFGRNVDFNDAYRYGFTRVGCWLCPNNNKWSIFLSKIYINNDNKLNRGEMTFQYDYYNWRNYLISFAKRIGKKDYDNYVDNGFWKARQGGNGMELSSNIDLSFKPCVNEENSFNYELKKPISKQLYEFFKPFGYINYEYGNKRLNEVYVLNKLNEPILRLSGRNGGTEVKVSVIKLPIAGCKNYHDIKLKIECQLTKYQMCLTCLACESVCRYDAIKVRNDAFGRGNYDSITRKDEFIYRIDNDKCVRCGECINHFNAGCYMRKVLIVKKEM